MGVKGQWGVVSRNVIGQDGHIHCHARSHGHLVVPAEYAPACGIPEDSDSYMALGALSHPVLDRIGEIVGPTGVGIGLIYQVIGPDLGDAPQFGCLVSQSGQCVTVPIGVDAG